MKQSNYDAIERNFESNYNEAVKQLFAEEYKDIKKKGFITKGMKKLEVMEAVNKWNPDFDRIEEFALYIMEYNK